MISNTRSKRVNENITCCTQLIKFLYICEYSCLFSFGFHYNALFVLITISNTNKRVNENITRQCTRKEKNNVYMQFFMFVGASVIEILLFNQEKKKQKMKNMVTL